jgi:hypothetical protein
MPGLLGWIPGWLPPAKFSSISNLITAKPRYSNHSVGRLTAGAVLATLYKTLSCLTHLYRTSILPVLE